MHLITYFTKEKGRFYYFAINPLYRKRYAPKTNTVAYKIKTPFNHIMNSV